MPQQRDIPYRSSASDVASLLIVILFVALAVQFWGRINKFAPLRSDGVLIEGRWIDRYREPQTGEYTAIYRFELNDKIYRGRQTVAEEDYGGDGQAVMIIYDPNNPELSRIQNTEQIVMTDVLVLCVATMIAILAAQYIFAYYRQQPSWYLILRHRMIDILIAFRERNV